jgi:hypothetical protein
LNCLPEFFSWENLKLKKRGYDREMYSPSPLSRGREDRKNYYLSIHGRIIVMEAGRE